MNSSTLHVTKISKRIAALLLCCALGLAIGLLVLHYQSAILNWSPFKPTLYETEDESLARNFHSQKPLGLTWSQLMPAQERAVIAQYQQQSASTAKDFADNILRSIEAASDTQYTSAMMSTNTVDTFDGKAVSVPGFVVPIDHYATQNPQNIFIVPYFGACIHFPPPPPNQIIFAQLGDGFADFDLSQAYLISGILKRGLFEDPLGTSAYILDVVAIEPYFEEPDDFRQH